MSVILKRDVFEETGANNGFDLSIGMFHSTSADAASGNKLSSAKTKILDVCADDNASALTAGSAYRASRSRTLITAAQSGNTSIFGSQSQLKITSVDSSTGNKAGIWGYLEAGSSATISANSAGVYACLDLPTGATASGTVGALQISSTDLTGTHTGKIAQIHCPNPVAGTFDYAMIFGDTTGATTANTHSIDSHALAYIIKVRVGSVDGFIPVLAAVPS